jgi:hypothetical protein
MGYRITFYLKDEIVDEAPLSQALTVYDLLNKKQQLAFEHNCMADDIEVRIGTRQFTVGMEA